MATNGNKKENDYVVALDIGTSKVVCLIGQLTDSHAVEIVALGSVSYTHLTLPTMRTV